MEYLAETFIVIGILVAVAVAAVAFEPANPLEKWIQLTDKYGTHDRPKEAQFTGQPIVFGGQRGGLKPLSRFIGFEATIDNYGLWLVIQGEIDPQVTPGVRVPGTHIRPAGNRGGQYRFDVYAEPPVRIAVGKELGKAIIDKSQAPLAG